MGRRMTDPAALMWWMALMAISLMTIAMIMVAVVVQTHRVTRQLQTLLPLCERTLHQTDRAMGDARRLVKHAEGSLEQIHRVVTRACEEMTEGLDQVARLKARAQAALARYFTSNGTHARSDPRGRA